MNRISVFTESQFLCAMSCIILCLFRHIIFFFGKKNALRTRELLNDYTVNISCSLLLARYMHTNNALLSHSESEFKIHILYDIHNKGCVKDVKLKTISKSEKNNFELVRLLAHHQWLEPHTHTQHLCII